jgi:hypothetical protein
MLRLSAAPVVRGADGVDAMASLGDLKMMMKMMTMMMMTQRDAAHLPVNLLQDLNGCRLLALQTLHLTEQHRQYAT